MTTHIDPEGIEVKTNVPAITTYGGIIPKTLLAACQKHTDKVKEIGNEGEDGYWIYFHAGWINAPMEVHCIHEWTVADCIRQLRDIVPCSCKDCKP